METTIQPPHPAIQQYMTALADSVRTMPASARGAILADAQEFLLSEWDSVRRRRREYSDERIYDHLVGKFGTPAEVAAAYSEAGDAGHRSEREPTAATSARQALLSFVALSLFALVAGGIAILWRQALVGADGGERTDNPAPAFVFDPQTMESAGSVVSSRRGEPLQGRWADPSAALGPPDYVTPANQNLHFTLGRGGELTIAFVNRWLCDGPGHDLLIFEAGHPESVEVAVSTDAETWIPLGSTEGGLARFDLAAHGLQDRQFGYVRIVDAQRQITRKPAYWGADIDAIVAIHTSIGRR